MSYSHIKPYQRNELVVLLRAGVKNKDIAILLNKDRTSIYRELKRNKCNNKSGYDVRVANKKTTNRRIMANRRFRKIENNKDLRIYIIKKIKLYWSPEQISGRWNKTHREMSIGKDSIYKFIYEKRKDLVKYLRCQKGK